MARAVLEVRCRQIWTHAPTPHLHFSCDFLSKSFNFLSAKCAVEGGGEKSISGANSTRRGVSFGLQ